MSISTLKIIEGMKAAGIDAATILAAVEKILAASMEEEARITEERRESTRRRVRRHREAKKDVTDVTDVTVTSSPSFEGSPSPFPDPSLTPSYNPPPPVTTLLPAREKFPEFDESNEDAAPVAETTVVPSPQPAGAVPAYLPHAAGGGTSVATFRRVQHWLEQQIPEFGVNCWPTATIHQWLDSGADPERDIFPTVERLCRQTEANGGRIRSLSYFTGAIADAVRVRTTPLPYNPEIEGNPYASTTRIYRNRPGKPSWNEALGNVLSKYETH